jgi:hypothetical protein
VSIGRFAARNVQVKGVKTVTRQVIGAGFGRTGTQSLQAALEALGFAPCYPKGSLFEHPHWFRPWEEARRRTARGEPVNWERILGGCPAAVHWPGIFFWRELVETYPAARVILTVWDPERWYESTYRTVYQLSKLVKESSGSMDQHTPPAGAESGFRANMQFLDKALWEETFGGRFADREHAVGVFEEHNAAVKAGVAPERLLVYEVKQGWVPLCRFLGVDIPADEPFPHLNDAETIQRRLDQLYGE